MIKIYDRRQGDVVLVSLPLPDLCRYLPESDCPLVVIYNALRAGMADLFSTITMTKTLDMKVQQPPHALPPAAPPHVLGQAATLCRDDLLDYKK